MAPGPAASVTDGTNHQMPRARSVLKRALLGLVLLFIMVSGGAWLMHAGIEAEAETAADEPAISAPAGQPR
jgi:hypothetical protein